MRERVSAHGRCLVCTEFGAAFFWDGEKCEAEFTPSEAQQGPPAHAHGGSLAALLDECMSKAAWLSGHRVLLAHLEIDCRRPVPLGAACRADARVSRIDGRKVWAEGRLFLPDGTLAAESRALYIEPKSFAPIGSGA
jgi:acyl-coenzyme A thioesterase PaaI-like protein